MSRSDTSSIRYSEKFYSKKFSDGESKEAYLKACKWLAKYVLSKPDLKNVEFGIEKIADGTDGLYIFELSLYAVLSEDELRERHCKICKETHSSFFISEETNCNWCKLQAYHKRADEMIGNKVQYYRDCLSRHMGGI